MYIKKCTFYCIYEKHNYFYFVQSIVYGILSTISINVLGEIVII